MGAIYPSALVIGDIITGMLRWPQCGQSTT
jgi:hypothetical protein